MTRDRGVVELDRVSRRRPYGEGHFHDFEVFPFEGAGNRPQHEHRDSRLIGSGFLSGGGLFLLRDGRIFLNRVDRFFFGRDLLPPVLRLPMKE